MPTPSDYDATCLCDRGNASLCALHQTYPREPLDDADRDACSFPFRMCGSVLADDLAIAYRCNRTEGHDGDHVAAMNADLALARWKS